MRNGIGSIRVAKLAALIAAALTIGACAKNPNDPNNAMASNAGAATPGSQQDFVVNVGDRVFFESDSSELTQRSVATLEKQAQWLSTYNRYAFTIEGHAERDDDGGCEFQTAHKGSLIHFRSSKLKLLSAV